MHYATDKEGITHVVDLDNPLGWHGPVATVCGRLLNPLTTITRRWRRQDAVICAECKKRLQNFQL